MSNTPTQDATFPPSTFEVPESPDEWATQNTNAIDATDATSDSPFLGESARTWDTPPETVESVNTDLILSNYLQAVLNYPSDRVIFGTRVITNNDPLGPVLITNRQLDSIGFRATFTNTGSAGIVWLLINNESAAPSATPGQVYTDGFPLAVGQSITLSSRSAIWAIAPGAPGTSQVSFAIETYEGGDQQ